MDSLTQITLGAAVGVAAMGRRTPAWKAALWGGLCGTLPDLDALIDFGDPIRNMTMHRGDSHALLWLSLAAVPIGALIARVHRETALWRRWALAVWLVLVTHALLDAMTVYGTQLARPFTDYPFGVGSIFIIDPAYTLPLLIGVIAMLRRDDARGARWNHVGLLLSTAYLAWSVAAQQQVREIALRELAAQGIAAEQVLVTPTAFNTLLWRIVVVTPDAYHEGFRSLLDGEQPLRFDRFERGAPLREALAGQWAVERIAWFSHGFYALTVRGEYAQIADLRMGQEPAYFFTFAVAKRQGSAWEPLSDPRQVGRRPDVRRGLDWLWRRALGAPIAPPR
jgi:inner membrane protein